MKYIIICLLAVGCMPTPEIRTVIYCPDNEDSIALPIVTDRGGRLGSVDSPPYLGESQLVDPWAGLPLEPVEILEIGPRYE